jgi:hypothetical protein
MDGGARKDRVVVNVAVQDAAVVVVAAVGAHVTAVDRVLAPFLNCTVPVGPAPLLFVATVAVSVMLPPETMLLTLDVTCVCVVALATVTVCATVAAAL